MASTRPSASRTYRTSRRRPSANTAAQLACHVHPRKGQRRRAAPATLSQAAASAGSRRSAHSIFTGSPRTRTSCGFALPSQVRRVGGARRFITHWRRVLAAAVTGLGHRLVDGGVEVVTQLVAEFLAHLLHEARDARRIVLVEVTRSAALRQRLEPRLLRLHGGE